MRQERDKQRSARRTLRAWAFLFALPVLTVAGCSQETRHEILTFFFTGVPPLEGAAADGTEQAAAPAGLESSALAARRSRQEKLQAIQRALRDRQVVAWAHGPFAAEECGRCHALGASKAFSGGGAQAGGAVAASIGPRLLMPAEELCLTCHTEKGNEAAEAKDLRVHGPVAAGLCVACHSPHQSRRRYMLLAADNIQMCTQCHDADGIRRRAPVHAEKQDADCVTCHNPHMGRSAMILRSEYNEREMF